jgi:hypothetical protein
MADQSKLLFVNVNGDYEESSSADSLKYASFKTDNHELTDTLLGSLVNAIVTSAGAADADKFVKTDANGQLDASLIPVDDLVEGGKGIDVTSGKVSADLASNAGLKFVGLGDDDDQLAIEPADFAGEGLVDDGSDNLAIDWSTAFNDSKAVKASDLSSTANGLGASIIGIEDADGYFTSTDVEGALKELYELDSDDKYNIYLAGASVSAGDAVYISANDTVQTFGTITGTNYVVGLAINSAAVTEDVQVIKDDEILSGLTFGGTPVAGARVYWNGTAHTTVIPAGGGAYVWQTGYIKDAANGELHVDVQLIKKNS